MRPSLGAGLGERIELGGRHLKIDLAHRLAVAGLAAEIRITLGVRALEELGHHGRDLPRHIELLFEGAHLFPGAIGRRDAKLVNRAAMHDAARSFSALIASGALATIFGGTRRLRA